MILPTALRFLPALALLGLSSCVVPNDYGAGVGSSSVSVGYRQYNSLPLGYNGDAYYYGGRYYSGGRYENGTFYNQGRSYNNRYYHGGQYYYGGTHQHHDGTVHANGSHNSSSRTRVGYDRNSRTRVSVPSPFSFQR